MSAVPCPRGTVDRDRIRAQIAEALDEPGRLPADDAHLLELGLDSLQLMRLVSEWRKDGADVNFAQLMESPRLADWWPLFARRLAAAVPERQAAVQAAEPPDDAPFALTDVQHAYWIGRGDEQVLGGVGCHAYLELDGRDVDFARLTGAWAALLAHHGMLRARFDDDGRQRILAEAAPSTRRIVLRDLRALAGTALVAELDAVRDALSHRRLRVEDGEVAGLSLSLLPGGATRLHLDVDLLVADVQSLGVILRDLATCYADGTPPRAPANWHFGHHLAARAAGRDEAQAARYWRDRLADLPGGPQLPLRRAPESLAAPRFSRRLHRLSPAQWAGFQRFTAAARVTPAMALAAAYAEALAAWSATPRFLLNLPLFDRHGDTPGLDDVIADFTSLLLVAADCGTTCAFGERARAFQAQCHADVAHGAWSGVRVQRELALRADGERSFAPVVFACNLGTPLVDTVVRAAFGTLGYMISQTPQVWLDHQVYEEEGELLLAWDAVDALFPDGLIDAMFAAYVRFVERLAFDDGAWQAPATAMLSDAQREVRAGVNATDAALAPRTLHLPVFEQATLAPERVAVVDIDGQPLSYRALAGRALRVAALLREHGVRAGDPVAVTLPRGADQIVAVLGVLAAGGCYVPVGVAQPVARQARIHQRAGIRHVISDAAHRIALTELDAHVIDIAAAAIYEPLVAPIATEADDLAYVIFTSGSTGEPKGVEISHRAAANTIDDLNRRFDVGPDDCVLAVSALDFDLSVYDIFGLLGVGGAVVLVGEADRREPNAWLHLVRTHRITLWNTVPVLLDMLLVAAGDQPLPLRLAFASGDWIGLDLPARLARVAPGARFIAMGGATEAAIWSNFCDVPTPIPEHWRSIPYGTPLANQQYRVVDSRGRDCPDWVPGELWIGGAGVALGYRGDPERTAASFVMHEGQRWYRTGDLGRYWPDGTLEFLGRRDHQIKLRGHRIELGEIEAALLAQPGVRHAIALVTGEPASLAAAVVTDTPLDERILTDALRTLLPDYMIPSHWLALDALPLSANGKLDRRALADRFMQAIAATPDDNAPPEGPVERHIAGLWRTLLAQPSISRTDHFFRLGGDSLLATRLVAQLQRDGWAADEPLRRLFAKPVLADFAAIWRQSGVSVGQRPAVAVALHPAPEHRHEPFPLTEIQRAYWMGQSDGLPLHGGTTYLLELDGGGVDLDRFDAAWRALWHRHDMLRAAVDEDGRQAVERSMPDTRLRIEMPVADARAARERIVALWHARDRSRALHPLHVAHAVPYCGERCRIGLFFDYLTLDGYSVKLLLGELAELYRDPARVPAPPALTFRDYVTQSPDDATPTDAALRYWRARVDMLPPAPALPVARDPASFGAATFVRRAARLPAPQWRRLRDHAQRHGLTPSVVLLTAYAQILATWSGGAALTLNLTLFDRRDIHPDVQRIVGDFTALAPVGFDAPGDESWAERATAVQQHVAEVLEHRTVSSVWIQRERARTVGLQAAALPIVFTSTLGLADDFFDRLPDGFPDLADGGLSETPQVWLDHQVFEHRGELVLSWDYVRGLFPDGLVDAMFDAYLEWVGRLADDETVWTAAASRALPGAQQAVRDRVNATDAAITPRTLHLPVFEQATLAPERVAVVDIDGQPLSYRALAGRALRVAALLREHGVRAGDPVAVTLPRGADQIVAVLGVLAAGGCYVPVGVAQPVARQARIHQRAGIRHALSDTSHRPALTGLDADIIDIAQASTREPLAAPCAISPDDPAYVIFTSGSTGEPKGVEISHRAAANTIDDLNRRFNVGLDDRMLAVSALDFDLSVYDIFGLLGVGGAVVLVGETDRREPDVWLHLVRTHRITLWNTVPVLLDMLLVAAGDQPLPLRLAFASGDWIGLDLPARLARVAPGARFIAMGGATEAAIWSNFCDVPTPIPERWRSIPYGTPLANQQYRVVDSCGRDCPDWVPGELWIGGAGVALGYRGDPERTAASFVMHEGQRWYRTGDLGRYWPDGTLEFLGRRDHQIKLRGHRIELGEIEAALLAQPGVRHAIALVTGEPASLAAAVVTDTPLDESTLTDALRKLLPDYMIPSYWLALDALPLSANGKLDRAALARQFAETAQRDTRREIPADPLERQLAALWSQVLGHADIARHDDFFRLGGDSLRAARLIDAIRRDGLDAGHLTLRQVFAMPSVAAQAAWLRAVQASPVGIIESTHEEGTL
ncbi:amino acid adenylation domain-containing protein [Burkholderia anthina]|uniref:non-ribosomal peptide synthetase n=1 Tax=Burkholderia anthina TaxID=179879 RepID=UPI001CF59F4C|nr:non-ribosomal peptide synthetase [Burkholderia anthina]MCA8093728.1 amino acid adenylation domain-containing protein [Burkholderia anthina]